MANEITIINGISKKERNGIYVYHFPLAIIEANPMRAIMRIIDIDRGQDQIVAFSAIADPLGAAEIVGYVDALANGGYYSLPATGAAELGAIETSNAAIQAATEASAASLAAIESKENIKLDVAGKVQTASIETDIDVKFRYDKQPLLFDEVLSGAATSVHEPDNSSILLTVSANNQYVIRQSFERFNYQSGKPKVGTFTFVNIAPQSGVIKRVGLYNGGITAPYNVTDGVYLESDGTDVKVCAAFLGVVFSVNQSAWTDKLDGTGASGVTVDWVQSQILTIEYLWLGYGPIRFSLLVGDEVINFHTINNGANTAAIPYMSSPNQPIRYEIRSTGGAGTFKQTCTTVGTSGGRDLLGIERGIDLGSAFESVNLTTLGTNYLVYASRLKSTSLDAQVKILSYEMLVTSNDDFIYYLIFNPTIAGAVTYAGQANSVTEIATGNGSQTVSGGTIISSGIGRQQAPRSANVANVLRLGHKIDGTRTEIVLAIKPLSNAATTYAYLNRVESI